MKYNLIAMLIIISIASVSCDKTGGPTTDGTSQTTPATGDSGSDTGSGDTDSGGNGTGSGTVTTPPVTSTVPALALSFGANVSMMDFTSAQTVKYNEAIAIVKKVVATEEFRSKVLNYNYNGTKMFSTTTKTNAQIYQSVLDAAETLKPAKNNIMDLGVKMYYEASTVVGWTNPSITYINVNTKFFDQFDANEVAGNLFHEWLHKLGYDHDSSSTARRPYSVPYAIGYLIRDIGADFL